MRLRQRGCRISDYAIEFRTLAAESDWNQEALFDNFIDGLSDPLKDQLAPLELPADLESLIALAIKINKRLFERERHRCRSAHSPPHQQGHQSPRGRSPSLWRRSSPPKTSSTSAGEPMQVGRTHLSPEERQRRLAEGRCIYCRQIGHFIATCPLRDSAPAHKVRVLTRSTLSISNPARLQSSVILTSSSHSVTHPIFVDSGSHANFMDYSRQLSLTKNLSASETPRGTSFGQQTYL